MVIALMIFFYHCFLTRPARTSLLLPVLRAGGPANVFDDGGLPSGFPRSDAPLGSDVVVEAATPSCDSEVIAVVAAMP